MPLSFGAFLRICFEPYFFPLLTCILLKGSVPAKIRGDSNPYLVICGFCCGSYIDKLWFAIADPVALLFFQHTHRQYIDYFSYRGHLKNF